MRRAAILALLTLALARPASAAAPTVIETRLPNGLQVLMVENHKVPLVALQLWYRVGSRNEALGRTGVSHLLEHLHYLGSKKLPPGQYDRLVESVGGDDNASTSEDYTDYWVEMPSDRLETALELEADAMRGLTLPANKFKSELQVVTEERRLTTDNVPAGVAQELLMAGAYTAHPYHWPIIGWMSDLAGMQRADVLEHYNTWYHPGNATLVLVGDFTPARARALIARHFGGIPAGPAAPRVRTTEPEQTGERRLVAVRQVETPLVMQGYHIPAAGHPDLYPLMIAASLLTDGDSSRLARRLVDELQVAQDVQAAALEMRDPGLFTLTAEVAAGRSPAELEQALDAELAQLRTTAPSAAEVARARHQLEVRWIMGQQRASDLAAQLGLYAALGDHRLAARYLAGLRAVRPADVTRVARQYLVRERRTVVTLAPQEAQP